MPAAVHMVGALLSLRPSSSTSSPTSKDPRGASPARAPPELSCEASGGASIGNCSASPLSCASGVPDASDSSVLISLRLRFRRCPVAPLLFVSYSCTSQSITSATGLAMARSVPSWRSLAAAKPFPCGVSTTVCASGSRRSRCSLLGNGSSGWRAAARLERRSHSRVTGEHCALRRRTPAPRRTFGPPGSLRLLSTTLRASLSSATTVVPQSSTSDGLALMAPASCARTGDWNAVLSQNCAPEARSLSAGKYKSRIYPSL
eukprot:scaffold6_cov245-Pinguiococcus_pyrenoidosus.AAC.7